MNPTRREVRLRPGQNGEIERQLPDEAAWVSTGLSRDTVLAAVDNETLDQFLARLIQTERIEDLAWDLRLSQQRNIGRLLLRSVFGAAGIGDPGGWLHFVPEIAPAGNDAQQQEANDAFLNLVCRIPWAFLTRADADNAPFLMLDRNEPVSITFDAAPLRGNPELFDEIKFPRHPRVLLVLPQVPDEERPTEERAHNRAHAALAPFEQKAPG